VEICFSTLFFAVSTVKYIHWVRLWEAKRSGDRVWFHLLEPYMTLVCAVYTMSIFYARLRAVCGLQDLREESYFELFQTAF
jgi:hypothetical protein